MPKRKRKTFVPSEESTDALCNVYKKHDGVWKNIMKDSKYKALGCSRNEANEIIKEQKTPFNEKFAEKVKEGDIDKLKDDLEDWRIDLSQIVG